MIHNDPGKSISDLVFSAANHLQFLLVYSRNRGILINRSGSVSLDIHPDCTSSCKNGLCLSLYKTQIPIVVYYIWSEGHVSSNMIKLMIRIKSSRL